MYSSASVECIQKTTLNCGINLHIITLSMHACMTNILLSLAVAVLRDNYDACLQWKAQGLSINIAQASGMWQLQESDNFGVLLNGAEILLL